MFYRKHQQSLFQCVLKSKTKYEKISNFWLKTQFNLLTFSDYITGMFLQNRNDYFLSTTSQNVERSLFQWFLSLKRSIKYVIFQAKIKGLPLRKISIYWLHNTHVLYSLETIIFCQEDNQTLFLCILKAKMQFSNFSTKIMN